MYCLFLLCASLYISLPHTCVCEFDVVKLSSNVPFQRTIQDYFKSESVQRLRKEWELVRRSYENEILTILNADEDTGSPGMNVYVRKPGGNKIAGGYFHNDNHVRVIFKDLTLEAVPFCSNPEVKFNLASNVLKLNTFLSKMIVHADYALLRNKSDLIHDPADQDPYKSSPFLFDQVQDVGKVAISMQACELKGFVTLDLDDVHVNIKHDRFRMFNCIYDIEIYRPGAESPPVIARYNMSNLGQGLGLNDFLKTPVVTHSLLPKLLSYMYSTINTTAIFGYNKVREYQEQQETVALLTQNKLAEVVRQMNKLTVEKNRGAIEMADDEVHWDDGRINPSNKNKAGDGETFRVTHMVLTGLDTLYSAHKGGPFMFDTIRIVEKLRFSSLQVRGKLEIISTWSDIFDFAAEISDLTMDLHIELSGKRHTCKPDSWIKDRKLEVEDISKMTFTVPTLMFESAENLIYGYLLREVPKLINAHAMAMFDQAVKEVSKTKPLNQESPDPLENKSENVSKEDSATKCEAPKKEQLNAICKSDKSEENVVREKDMLKKGKKRLNKRPHKKARGRGRPSGKRVAKN